MGDLPEYTVRESARAKRVRLKMTVEEGLVVVIPKDFARSDVSELLREKASWIKHAGARVEVRRRAIEETSSRPDRICFRAVERDWEIEWHPTPSDRAVLREVGRNHLIVRGGVENPEVWRPALRRWVLGQGRKHLTAWLEELAVRRGIEVKRTSIRCQRTRWGSYSATGTVSLNAQLLFLPPDLARYVLQHELCHVQYPDHSPAFWARLTDVEPETRRWRAELRDGWRFVPGWLSHASTAAPD